MNNDEWQRAAWDEMRRLSAEFPPWLWDQIADMEAELTTDLHNYGFPGYTVRFDITPLRDPSTP